MQTNISDLLARLTELSPAQAMDIQSKVVNGIEPYLDRSKFTPPRSRRPLVEWDYLWDALAWEDDLVVKVSLKNWVESVGDCWLLADHFRGRAWLASPNLAKGLKGRDVYLVPCQNPSVCYIETHEIPDIGPFLLPLVH